MPVTQKTRVHNALIKLAQEGLFRAEKFDPKTGLMSVCDLVSPKSVYTDETSGAWAPSTNRCAYNRDRDDWTWDLIIEFRGPVDASEFEASITQPAAKLGQVREGENQIALRSVRLDLTNASYSHPTRVSPTGGTKITYTFSVEETHR